MDNSSNSIDSPVSRNWYSYLREFFFGKEKLPHLITAAEPTLSEHKLEEQAKHIFDSLKRLNVAPDRFGYMEIAFKAHEATPDDKKMFIKELHAIWKSHITDSKDSNDQVPDGLKMIVHPPQRDPQVAIAGISYDNLVVQGDKRFGVEPGFESTKKWTERDSAKLNNPNYLGPNKPHRFREKVLRMFDADGVFKNTFFEADGLLGEGGPRLRAYLTMHPNETLESVLKDTGLFKDVFNELKKTELKFTKKHFVKLTYGEPEFGRKWSKSDTNKLNKVDSKYYNCAIDYLYRKCPDIDIEIYLRMVEKGNHSLTEIIGLLGKTPEEGAKILEDVKRHIMGNLWKVHIPTDRAVKKFGPIKGRIYQATTAETARDKNLSAVNEALANDIYSALNFGGQKLKLRFGEYESGYPKLLLDGTEVMGANGEKFSTLEGHIQKGRLVGNAIQDEDGNSYPIDTRQLGGYLIKALLMGDRDKIGSAGANVGFVLNKAKGQAIIMNIDPGKAMPTKPSKGPDEVGGKTDLMTFENVNTDFSFVNAGETFADRQTKGYKNFTIFSDTTLAEKMHGMREIIENWDKIENIFAKYLEFFERNNPNDPLDFGKEIRDAYQRLVARKEYFESVFQERLQMKTIAPSGKLVQDDTNLNLLDNIEKLTSMTTNYAGGKKKGVQLLHLQVRPGKRKEWNPIIEGNGVTIGFKFSGTKMDANIVHDRLIQYLQYHEAIKFNPDDVIRLKIDNDGDKADVTIDLRNLDDKELKQFLKLFSEDPIADYKGQSLLSPPEDLEAA